MNSRKKSGNTPVGGRKIPWRLCARMLPVVVFGTSVPSHAAFAGDTERLAQCIATADLAAAAVKSRDHGIPAERAKQAIASNDTTEEQLKDAIATAYGPNPLTPEQASRKVLQNCLEANEL